MYSEEAVLSSATGRHVWDLQDWGMGGTLGASLALLFPREDMGYVGGSTVSMGQQLRKVVDTPLHRWGA